MSTKKKLFLSAAGAAGGAGLDVSEVFSTYLYPGTGSTLTISNGLDLSGEGGLVWTKLRTDAFGHVLIDTVRGGTGSCILQSNSTSGAISGNQNDIITPFNSNGYTIATNQAELNSSSSNYNYCSWSFRKASKFFDVVTYTGNGTAGRTVAHNLGSVPGMIILKNISSGSEGWRVYHRGANGGTNPEQYYGMLQSENAFAAASTVWNNTAPTSTVFTVGSDTGSNNNGDSFVAYLFAHNNSDGEFGPDADQDIIKCDSYTATNSTSDLNINVGFEPQWVLIKSTEASAGWVIYDRWRGVGAKTGTNAEDSKVIFANLNQSESGNQPEISFNKDGFRLNSSQSTLNETSGNNYIYVAIRLSMKEIAGVAEGFSLSTRTSSTPAFSALFPVDFYLLRNATSQVYKIADRHTLGRDFSLGTSVFQQETNGSYASQWDYQNGFGDSTSADTNRIAAMWKRAANHMDYVDWDGTGASLTVNHKLEKAPELMFVKARDESDDGFIVWSTGLGANEYLRQNSSDGKRTSTTFWDNQTPTATSLFVKSDNETNKSGADMVAYLFTSNDFQKIGTYTGNGSATQDIDLGFSNGVDFLMIKRLDNSSNWFTFDSKRGINSGNETYYQLNGSSSSSSFDIVDPLSSGFTAVKGTISINESGGTYLYWAIAI